jgi:hypothetical protein
MAPTLEVIWRNMILVPLAMVGPLRIRTLNLVNLTREWQQHGTLIHQRRILVACMNDLEDLVEMLRIMIQEHHSQHALHRVV